MSAATVTVPTPRDRWSAEEMMTVVAARTLRNGQVCLLGIGLPSTAAHLARRLHAPDLVLVDGAGVVGVPADPASSSAGDGSPAGRATATVGLAEIVNYWLQGGRIDVGFLDAAQIDRLGNLNTTVIGEYDEPVTRLAGAGSAPEIAACARETVVVLRHRLAAFVEEVDFVTAVGYGSGPGDRERRGLPGAGPVRVITDLGVLEPDPHTAELVLTATHPGVSSEQVRAETGWDLLIAESLHPTPPPTAEELAALRLLTP